MRVLLSIWFLSVLCTFAEPDSVVALPNGVSPGGEHEVVLEADKGTPRFEKYEFKGEETQFPAFLIREVKSGKVLKRVRWQGDAGSDGQPLRLHSEVLWSPSSSSVILNTNERFYSHSSIWTLDPATGEFKEAHLPDYKTLTGYEEPSSDDLRPRGFGSCTWAKNGDLLYEIRLSPLNPKEGGDPFRHKITLRIGAKGFEVIAREKLKE